MAEEKGIKEVVAAIKAAVPYQHDKDVKANLTKLLDLHARDQEDVGYVASTDTEDALKDLERSMNEFDERVAAQRAELKEALAESREEVEAGGS